jgi:[acyl-carrier-protein] S-malonyltransferase
MAAVLSGKPAEVTAAIEASGAEVANNNGKGQIVAGGTTAQLADLAAHPPTRTRVVPLSVAGAFHTRHMQPAVTPVAELAATMSFSSPGCPMLSDLDGKPVTDGNDVRDRLIKQIVAPVRWDLCLDALANLGVTAVLELAPAGTLTGIVKRNLPGVDVFALNSPADLDDARAFCHAAASPKELS